MKQPGLQADPTTGTRIGYTRVSTVVQTLDQQNEALAAAGSPRPFPTPCPVPATIGPAWLRSWTTSARASALEVLAEEGSRRNYCGLVAD